MGRASLSVFGAGVLGRVRLVRIGGRSGPARVGALRDRDDARGFVMFVRQTGGMRKGMLLKPVMGMVRAMCNKMRDRCDLHRKHENAEEKWRGRLPKFAPSGRTPLHAG